MQYRCPRHPSSRLVLLKPEGLFCVACGGIVGPDHESDPDIEVTYEERGEPAEPSPISELPTPRVLPPLPHDLPPHMQEATPMLPPGLVPEECPKCGGTGTYGDDECPLCGGDGSVLAAVAAAFRIPPVRVPQF